VRACRADCIAMYELYRTSKKGCEFVWIRDDTKEGDSHSSYGVDSVSKEAFIVMQKQAGEDPRRVAFYVRKKHINPKTGKLDILVLGIYESWVRELPAAETSGVCRCGSLVTEPVPCSIRGARCIGSFCSITCASVEHKCYYTKCATCSEKDLLKCAKCGSVWYCNATCQKANWPTHKSECQLLQETRVASVSRIQRADGLVSQLSSTQG